MSFYYKREYRGPVKCVIFDWAGTTLDYGCYAPAVVFIEVFKRHGVEISIGQARGPMGLHKQDHIRTIAQMDQVREEWIKVNGRDWTEADIESMFLDEFKPLQMECLADYADLIPGTIETVDTLRNRGIKIGSTTGYFGEAAELLLKEAEKRGYVPDTSVCATDVPAGRPHPWMVLQNMINLETYPPEAVVKVGDTQPDIYEGLNAGVWTIGLAKTGNEIGLKAEEIKMLTKEDYERKLERATTNLHKCGAHYVADTIDQVPPIIDAIEERLKRGEKP